ncbi:hypothetical protein FRC00_002602 [Tulasnella sp. 408]|nr:hypothetical protein FRC00_002602 [Tulasnella sp. 408]
MLPNKESLGNEECVRSSQAAGPNLHFLGSRIPAAPSGKVEAFTPGDAVADSPPVVDLRPSDVLIERCVEDAGIVGIADIENNTGRELTKLGAVIQVPFPAGNQFLGEGGLQEMRS